MPGSDSAIAADDFDPGEVAGMRAAGWILLATAVLAAAGWLLGGTRAPLTAIVDVVLGVQLLRLRHSWRAWAMLRAIVAIVIALVVVASSLATQSATTGMAVMFAAQLADAGSLLLVLYGRPTVKRVRAGWAAFAVSLVLSVAGGMLVNREVTRAWLLDEPTVTAIAEGGAVELRGLTPADLNALRAQAWTASRWQRLWRISDPDIAPAADASVSEAPALGGSYFVTDQTVVFIPDQPLRRNAGYEWYLFPGELPSTPGDADPLWRRSEFISATVQIPSD
jgi:hypothetical protein